MREPCGGTRAGAHPPLVSWARGDRLDGPLLPLTPLRVSASGPAALLPRPTPAPGFPAACRWWSEGLAQLRLSLLWGWTWCGLAYSPGPGWGPEADPGRLRHSESPQGPFAGPGRRMRVLAEESQARGLLLPAPACSLADTCLSVLTLGSPFVPEHGHLFRW